MGPTDKKMKSETFRGKGGNWKKPRNDARGVQKKRKWIPEHKTYEGSVKEGQGFAFRRKQKVKHDYNKLLRKERKKQPETKPLYQEEYPEHLKHLYVSEAKQLKQLDWTNTVNRRKARMKDMKGDTTAEAESAPEPAETTVKEPEVEVKAEAEAGVGSELTSVTEIPEPTPVPEKEILPISNRMRKKMLKKTSYQKTKEEFDKIKEKRRKKKEEYLKNKQQREEALQRYKKKKMEMYQILSKKTKKGQPNLNLQMEYLLKKIQQNMK
ncbi:thyroid transcription factor 1-associated protein 26 homolog [Betta splendens]|uniref:Thyroid transcription factor 1-associated protein 26 homolog n=1 Tax=Betta splendens TaxID=158456 RepID=A0A6P7NHQ1_BETSP|nr:thyroid transcription factor 1-associated protein 26 homolog [Betta splendens]